MSQLRIEILAFEGCPNAVTTHELVREAVRLEAVDAAIDFVEVETPELAGHLRFLGSPSVRIDGEDVEPMTENRAYGLMCRTYDHGTIADGTPPIAMVRAAIRRQVAANPVKKVQR